MTKKALLSAAVLLWVSIPVATASTVSGTVTNLSGGLLSSMVVQAYGTQLQGATNTDLAGHYSLTLPSGSFRLLVYDPQGIYATAFAGNADSFDTTPAINAALPVTLNFSMQLGGTITGTIAVANGGPLAGATLDVYNLSGTRRGSATANSSGVYSILVPPGQYKIVAYDNAGAYAPRFYPDIYGFSPATPVAVSAGALVSGKNIDLEVAGHLVGSIVDSATGLGLPGTTAYAYASNGVNVAQTTTDSSGNFVMNIAPGSYRLVGSDPKQVYATGFPGDSESFDQSDAIPVVATQTINGLQIPLHRGGIESGHATSGGTPLANITVAAYNEDGSQRTTTQTDTSGAYTLVLPGGDFRVAAYDMQQVYATQFYAARDAFAEANDVPIVSSTTTTPADFRLIRAGKISGSVIDATTGLPASNVGVSAYDTLDNLSATATSDSTGAYTLALAPGSYRIVAFDPQLRYATAYGGGALSYQAANAYTISSSQVQTLNFSMTSGVQLGGSVRDSGGDSLSGIEIGALDSAGNRVSTAISSDGSFGIVLLPGSYRFLALDATGHYSPVYYSRASTLAAATTVVVQRGTVPPAITFVMGSSPRHRAVPH